MNSKIIIVFVLLLFIGGVFSSTSYANDVNVDPEVILISSSDIVWTGPDRGFLHRLVVVMSEVYLNLFIQRIDYGEENCCAEVSKTYELNMQEAGANLFSISDVKWLSVNSLTFRGNSTYYKITRHGDKYRIEKLTE